MSSFSLGGNGWGNNNNPPLPYPTPIPVDWPFIYAIPQYYGGQPTYVDGSKVCHIDITEYYIELMAARGQFTFNVDFHDEPTLNGMFTGYVPFVGSGVDDIDSMMYFTNPATHPRVEIFADPDGEGMWPIPYSQLARLRYLYILTWGQSNRPDKPFYPVTAFPHGYPPVPPVS